MENRTPVATRTAPTPAKAKRRRPTHQPGFFLDQPLLEATRAALTTRAKELGLVVGAYEAVLEAKKHFGESREWIRKLELDGMLDHMEEALGAMESEGEFLCMLTQGHAAVKQAARKAARFR